MGPDRILIFSSARSCSKSEVWGMFLVPSGCREMRQQLRRQRLCFKVGILQTDSPKPFRTIVGMEHAWHRQLTVYKSQEPARPRQIVF